MGTEEPLRGPGWVGSEVPDPCLHQAQEAGEGVPRAEGQRGVGGLSSKNGCLSSSQEGPCHPTAPATPGNVSALSICQEIVLG